MEKLVESLCGLILLSGWFSFSLSNKQVLTSLLSLEFVALGVFFLLSSSFLFLGQELFYSLYFLVLAVSEGVLGLSLLVMISYSHGSGNLKNAHSLVC